MCGAAGFAVLLWRRPVDERLATAIGDAMESLWRKLLKRTTSTSKGGRDAVSNPKLIEAVQAMLQANCRLLFGDDLIVRTCDV